MPDKQQSPSVTVLSSVCGVHFREECRGCISAKESNDERIEALHAEREKLIERACAAIDAVKSPFDHHKQTGEDCAFGDALEAAEQAVRAALNASPKDSPDAP
jgi:hypothetical protein